MAHVITLSAPGGLLVGSAPSKGAISMSAFNTVSSISAHPGAIMKLTNWNVSSCFDTVKIRQIFGQNIFEKKPLKVQIYYSAWPQSFPLFSIKKRWKSGTLWEHLPKRHHFWTIIKQRTKKVGHFRVRHFGVMDCIQL